AGGAEQVRDHRGAPEVGDPARERQHLRGDPGHLGDHDDRRPGASAVDGPLLAVVGEGGALEVVDGEIGPGHGAGPYCLRRMPTAPRPFRFGLQASALPGGTAATAAAGWSDLARKAEDLGFATLTVADHLDDQLAVVPAIQAAADATTTL